ncbi:prolipoprotein diacylglyceryl transferase [Sediminicoccus sp. KRV36]|uniref:prolipoprotein diacylglyceryl transferase n=1 Tax=Sediminicoccus sp. KRV36 TaxID=3133721 RepID=UPI002010B61A|nr:prolipoprotein diacylglyceryl transferase [Sediminicoccus rosea]UPY39272.1 prolipoprotein diacylglyceryl transferase [Sediminicoccus rosea]
MFEFPQIDPVAIQIGPIAIRWYALAYIAGIVLGWRLLRRLAAAPPQAATPAQVDDYITWATLGIILGGRLGYVLFYRPGHYLFHPLEALMVWQGGMAFHGGALGVIIATLLFCRSQKLNPLVLGDRVAVVVPIGLFFGRLANFINGELWGRAADVPWAMVFPTDRLQIPRHPSQLYQAGLEGLALFALMLILWSNPANRARTGLLTGALLAGYGVARLLGEFFREPDAHLGFLLALGPGGGATMGQLLSLPMVLAGAWLIWRARRA